MSPKKPKLSKLPVGTTVNCPKCGAPAFINGELKVECDGCGVVEPTS